MADQEKAQTKSPYEMEIADSKRARRSKILILSSGVAVGATMLVGAAIAVNHELSEDHNQEQVQEHSEDGVQPSLDPQGKFTPGYAEGEEREHVGSDEDHPENIYHEDDGEKHSDSESGDDD